MFFPSVEFSFWDADEILKTTKDWGGGGGCPTVWSLVRMKNWWFRSVLIIFAVSSNKYGAKFRVLTAVWSMEQ